MSWKEKLGLGGFPLDPGAGLAARAAQLRDYLRTARALLAKLDAEERALVAREEALTREIKSALEQGRREDAYRPVTALKTVHEELAKARENARSTRVLVERAEVVLRAHDEEREREAKAREQERLVREKIEREAREGLAREALVRFEREHPAAAASLPAASVPAPPVPGAAPPDGAPRPEPGAPGPAPKLPLGDLARKAAAAAGQASGFLRRLVEAAQAEPATSAAEAAPEEIIAWTTETLRTDPADATVLHRRGLAHLARCDYARALEDFSEVVRLRPRFAAAWCSRARARLGLDDEEGAIEDATEAIRLEPSARAHATRATALLRARAGLREAETDATRAIRLDRAYLHGLYVRSGIRCELGDGDGALSDATEAVDARPGVLYLWNRGSCRLRQGDAEGALADAGRAIALDPTDAGVYHLRAEARRALGDHEGAAADLEQMVRLGEHEALVWKARAATRSREGRRADALLDVEEGLRISPDDGEARLLRALFRLAGQDLAGAEEDAEAALRLAPRDPRAARTLAFVAVARGEWGKALTLVDGAVGVRPRSAPALEARAWVRALAGDLAGARADLDLALHEEPALADAWLDRALLRARAGDREGALSDLERAARRAPFACEPARYLAALGGDRTRLERFATEPGWPGALTRFVQGTLAWDALLALVPGDGPDWRPRLCEAHGFAGLLLERDGPADRAGRAREHYEQCVARNVVHFREHAWAAGRLADLAPRPATEADRVAALRAAGVLSEDEAREALRLLGGERPC